MKGVYILVLDIARRVKIRIGSLGEVFFIPGRYIYVGSGQNNVEKRIMRHFRKYKKIRWHIDYLLSSDSCKIIRAFIYPLDKEYECRISSLALALGGIPIKRFGSSDCRCISHLFKLKDPLILEKRIKKLFMVKPISIY
ncbi:MAG: GIY-YIG nuclease family protein [Candidatus Caldarchaeales archaeon]